MIIGRKRELEYLENAFSSKKAQFITVYGRRRVGKTFLIEEFFKDKKGKVFKVTGIMGGSMRDQLKTFADALSETFFSNAPLMPLKSWKEAFSILRHQIMKSEEKVVVFLDELPWLATSRSKLMQVIDHDWNRYFTKLPQMILVVCGSSVSWMLKKIIYDRGGLHNRTTCELAIDPFDLLETREYLQEIRGISYTDKQVLSLYMAVGGIPYYLKYAKSGLSVAENIQSMFFAKRAPLQHEFHKLFESLFTNASIYIKIVRLIAKKRFGISRAAICDGLEIEDGGGLSDIVSELEKSGFIHSYLPLGHKKKGEYYRLTDEFCLFYLYWVEGNQPDSQAKDYWIKKQKTPEYRAWSGYTFETICIDHVHQIITALEIPMVSKISSWRYMPQAKSEQGAQIGLVIDSDDDVITLCEIKYTDKPFVIDKSYAQVLQRKVEVFRRQTKTEKLIFMALVAANGVKDNLYLKSAIDNVVTLKDLFKPL